MGAGSTELHVSVPAAGKGNGDAAAVDKPAVGDGERNGLTEGGFATLARSFTGEWRSNSRELLECGERSEPASLAPSGPFATSASSASLRPGTSGCAATRMGLRELARTTREPW